VVRVLETLFVVNVWLAEVLPARMVIEDGMFRICGFGDFVNETTAPPAGAGPSNVTVIVVTRSPRTTLGENVIPTTRGARTVRFAE